MSACSSYSWCREDHGDGACPDDEHSKAIVIKADDIEEEFILEIIGGRPGMNWVSGLSEVWIKPDETVNTFESVRAVLAEALARYAEFSAKYGRQVKRPTNTDRVLEELEN